MLRRRASAIAAAVAVLAMAACSGPAGVDLGTNWDGAETFVLARVNNLTTVVGIDPQSRSADALAVVPTQSDDDDVLSPSIIHLADGRWVVTIPKKGGKPSRLYVVDTKSRVLDVAGTIESGRSLVSAGSLVVAVGAASRSNGKPDALVYATDNWQTRRVIPLPMDPKVAGANEKALCVAADKDSGSEVAVVPLDGTKTPTVSDGPKLQVQAIDCSTGSVVIAGTAPNSASVPAEPTLRLDTAGDMQVVTASEGRVDQLFADNKFITVAVSIPDGVRLVTVRRSDGAEVGRARVDGFAGAAGMQASKEGWLIFDGDRAALVKTGDTEGSPFSLPGQLLDTN